MQMLDIIPSTPSSKKPGRSFSRPRRDDASVVKVDFKLPARLRKPIHQQLAQERRRKQQQQAIVRFERRPVITEHVQTKQQPNVGVEHHTGDVYRHTRPASRVSIPPYAGRFAKQLVAAARPKPKPLPVRSVAQAPVPKPRPLPQPVKPVQIARPKAAMKHMPSILGAERDVPFDWSALTPASYPPRSEAEVIPPAPEPVKPPTFSLPVSFSIWPISLLPSLFGKKKILRGRTEAKALLSKLKKRGQASNIVLLLVGCLISLGLVSNLRTLGRGSVAIGPIEERAQAALAQLTQAQTALAQTDFAGSEQAFAGAQEDLRQAQAQFDAAFSSSKELLRLLDVTHTVASGEDLLAAGEHITQAGQHISRGMAPLLASQHILEDKGQPAGGTTLVDAVNTSLQELTAADDELAAAEKALNNVHSVFLPENVKQQVARLQEVLPPVHALLSRFVAQSGTMLSVLGADHEKQYLLVFANNHELRPVGGFLGSVALVNVNRGRVENIDVHSVYDPDGQLKEFIAPPNPLLAITNRWYMRDANWFVSYPLSAAKISNFFEKEGGPTVDGVMLLTPEVIRHLLTVTGPLEVPGYDVKVSADNFYAVTQDEVTYNYDKAVNKPKQFLSDLAPLLLNTLISSGNTSKLSVLEAFATSLRQKDLLLYFRNQDIQTQIAQAGWSGELPADAPGFLEINNANIGGHKSDQFMSQEADYRAEVKDNGDVDVVLTIRRTHHGPTEDLKLNYPPGENPACKDNTIYQRVLVPKGAQLVEAQGYTPEGQIPHLVESDSTLPVKPDEDIVAWQQRQQAGPGGTMVGSESGYTTFANWIITKPGQTTVTLYHYILPHAAPAPNPLRPSSSFSLYIAKQPGQERSTVRASVQLPDSYKIIHRVPASGVTQENDNSLVYRGDIQQDIVVGAVYDKR
jgi:hypothetical protein